jgi:hypothetical protein
MPTNRVGEYYPERAVDAATGQGYRSAGLHTLLKHVLAQEGRPVPPGKLTDTNIREAFELSPRAGGLSTVSIPGVLSNIATKFALVAFDGANVTWPLFCRKTSTTDFKQFESVRLSLTGGRLKQLAPGGFISHHTLDDATVPNQVATYAGMLALDRTMIVNDDLSLLSTIPAAFGRNGAVTLERKVYEVLLDNSSFFAAGNANVSTGAGSALALAGLNAAMRIFTLQTDPNGDPVMLVPAVLLAPPTLYATARTLMNSATVIDATGQETEGNPWVGLATPATSAYMEDAALTGNSSAAWYLLSGPGDFAVVEVAFLNSREAPVIETASLDFNQLGVQFRGFFDFGVAQFEPKGGVRSAGS